MSDVKPSAHTPTDPGTIAATVDRLRETFNSGKTYSYEWRLQQLKALQRLATEGKEHLSEALYKDLHRSRFESHLIELGIVDGEVQHAIDHLADWMKPVPKATNIMNAPGTSYVHADPLGVALIMSPWNYPAQLCLGPLVGAISAGNCAVLRPAEYTSNVAAALAELIPAYLDTSAFAVIIGGREVTTAALECRFDSIFFTGGPTLGRIVYQSAVKHLTPVSLELGGKSPAYVDATADIDIAARRLAWGAFSNAGQTCVRPDYVLADASIADDLITRVNGYIQEFYFSAPSDPTEYAYSDAVAAAAENNGRTTPESTPYYGRIVNGGGAAKRLAGIIERDKAYLVTGGQTDVEKRYIAPTVLDFRNDEEAFNASAAMEGEIFGPIMPVLRVSGIDQVMKQIKSREKPLALYVFTTSKRVRETFEIKTSSGGLVFNDVMVHLTNEDLPFGGVGESGMGNYHGKYSFDTFSHQKAVLVKKNILDMAARYPPYTSAKRALIYSAGQPFARSTKRLVLFSAVASAAALGALVTFGNGRGAKFIEACQAFMATLTK